MSVWRKLPVFVYPQDNAKQMARAGSALPRLSSSPPSPFISQLVLFPPPALKNDWYNFHTEKEQLLSQHKADFGSVAFQKPQACDFKYPQHD